MFLIATILDVDPNTPDMAESNAAANDGSCASASDTPDILYGDKLCDCVG